MTQKRRQHAGNDQRTENREHIRRVFPIVIERAPGREADILLDIQRVGVAALLQQLLFFGLDGGRGAEHTVDHRSECEHNRQRVRNHTERKEVGTDELPVDHSQNQGRNQQHHNGDDPADDRQFRHQPGIVDFRADIRSTFHAPPRYLNCNLLIVRHITAREPQQETGRQPGTETRFTYILIHPPAKITSFSLQLFINLYENKPKFFPQIRRRATPVSVPGILYLPRPRFLRIPGRAAGTALIFGMFMLSLLHETAFPKQPEGLSTP